jgi:FixJ family two-component response regulator
MKAERKPRCFRSEADFQQMMLEFIDGATDREIAAKWGISKDTVAAQRAKRGVMRGLSAGRR